MVMDAITEERGPNPDVEGWRHELEIGAAKLKEKAQELNGGTVSDRQVVPPRYAATPIQQGSRGSRVARKMPGAWKRVH